jgi:hypothetical protein
LESLITRTWAKIAGPEKKATTTTMAAIAKTR